LGGVPPGARFGANAGFHGGGRGLQANVRSFQGRSAAYSSSRSARYSYSGRYGYGRALRYGRWARHGAYAYGTADSDSDCYSTYSYSLNRRVRICSDD
jgi:hypothetical protein